MDKDKTMNKKYFVIEDKIKPKLSKEERAAIIEMKERTLKNSSDNYLQNTKKRLTTETVNLKHTDGRIIIKIDIDGKDIHAFESGVQIYRGRRFNNLNRRETEPVNAWVVSSEYIPKGFEILIHPNSICDAHKIFNYGSSDIEQGNSVRYYSIEEPSAFLFREGNEWKPLKGFAIGLRVFKTYKGSIVGILPAQIKDILYLQSGEFNGQCVQTLRSCDYEIIFQGTNGREQRKIRCRHYENEPHDREEIIMLRNDLTELVNKGKLLIGLSPSDCKIK